MALSDIHDRCIEAAKAMQAEGVMRHTSYVNKQEAGDVPAGMLIRVTIDYVVDMEASPQGGKKVAQIDESRVVTERK